MFCKNIVFCFYVAYVSHFGLALVFQPLTWRKKGNVLFNDTLNTLFTVMWCQTVVKNQWVRKETCCHHFMSYSSWLSARDLIYASYHRVSFQPVLLDWCNKGRGMCYPVCGMVHIKEPLLLIDKSSLCGGSGFSFSLSEWSLTICLTP